MFSMKMSEMLARWRPTHLLAGACLLVATIALAGCSQPECAEGTFRVGSDCELVSSGCGPGTMLVEGFCVLDSEACGPGARGFEGDCVPDGDAICADSTTFDQATGQCVPDTSVACGPRTTLDASGKCVPSEDACQSPAVLDDGLCVVGPRPCGDDAELDPNTNTCVSTEVDCQDGTMWDADARRCVISETICAEGTELSDDGLCLPDVCDTGDVMFGPVCVPSEAVDFGSADLEHTEERSSQPPLDENHLSMPADGEQTVARGILYTGAPQGTPVARDVDVFTFDADAFQWVDLALRNFGYPGANFTVTGPNGTVWESPVGHRYGTGRQLLLPLDGRYEVAVSHDRPPGDPYYLGAENWAYALVLQPQAAPEPRTIDVSSRVVLSDDALGLRDNLYRLEGLSQMQRVDFRAEPGGLPGLLALRSGLAGQAFGDTVLDYDVVSRSTGDQTSLTVLVDWRTVEQAPAPFELEVVPGGVQIGVDLDPGESTEVTIPADRFDRLSLSRASTGSDRRLVYEVFEPDDDRVVDEVIEEDEAVAHDLFENGDYRVRLTNKSDEVLPAQVPIETVAPVDLGVVGVAPTVRQAGLRKRITLEASADGWVELASTCDANTSEFDIEIIDQRGQGVRADATQINCRGAKPVFPVEAGQQYLVRVSMFPAEPLEISARMISPTQVQLDSAQSQRTFIDTIDCTQIERDFYEVSLGDRGRIDATFRSVNSFLVGELAIYRSDMLWVGDYGTYQDLLTQVLPAGPYLVRAGCQARFDPGTYELELGAQFVSPPDLGALGAGSSVTHTVPGSVDTETVRVNVTAGTRIRFQLRGADGRISVHGEDGERYALRERLEDASSNPDFEYVHRARLTETLFVRVSGVVGSFDVDLEMSAEAVPDAGVLGPGGATVSTGPIALNQQALVRFELGEPGWVFGEVTVPSTNPATLTVYDAAGAIVDEIEASSSFALTNDTALPAGAYFVTVKPAIGDSGTYDLALFDVPESSRSTPNLYVGLDPAGVSDQLSVSGCGVVDGIDVFVELQTFRRSTSTDVAGSVELTLESPSGTSVRLSEISADRWDGELALFGARRGTVGSLSDFAGDAADGTWTLEARDDDGSFTHDIERWGVKLRCR